MDIKEWMGKNIGFTESWVVDSVEFNDNPNQIEVKASYIGGDVCPECGKNCPKYDTRKRKWRDFFYGDAPCIVEIEVPRFFCPEHGIHEVKVKWAGEASKLTKRFERMCLTYAQAMPVHLAGKLLHVHDNTIWKILGHYKDEALKMLDLSHMDSFCIDETSSKKGHQYITTVTDPHTGGIVFATPGHDSTTLQKFLSWLKLHKGDPANIKSICCDMSVAYTKGIREFFPNSVISYDPFHVIQAANATLDKVRRTSGLKGKLGQKLRFAFLSNRESITDEKKQHLSEVFSQYFHLGKAYALKEQLRDFYTVDSYEVAVPFLVNIIDKCLDSKNRYIFDLGMTLDHHFRGILEWHRTRMSNGLAEGNNSVIQAMKRTARGFSNPENMITLVYLRSMKKNGLSL